MKNAITCSAIISVRATKNPDYVQMFISWTDADEMPFTSYPLRTAYTQDWLLKDKSYMTDLEVKKFKGKLFDVRLSNVQELTIVERLKLLKELKS